MEHYLIIKVLGRKIGFDLLERKLQLWKGVGLFEIVDLGYEFYLIKFSCMEDKNYILDGGPWMIFDHYVTIREWEPNFNLEQALIDSTTVWICFPELALEYHDRRCLKAMGNRIGMTLKVDITIEEKIRGKYARVYVLVNLTKPLLPLIRFKG